MQNGALIDNVHINGANILKTASGYVGGLVRYGTKCMIRNSSVSNIKIETIMESVPSEQSVGGIIGRILDLSIENCYVQGIEINDVRAVNSGVGGIAGYGTGTNNIRNCYSEGKINSENMNVGGIIGNISEGNIENCYSKVRISTTNSNVGGIVGVFADVAIENVSNNLSLNNIYSTQGVENLGRIAGNNLNTENANYAHENQLLNGYINEQNMGATLLSKEEVLNLNLGEGYKYDKKDEGILPKLYNIEGTELLPNQTDIQLDMQNAELRLEIERIETTKPNTTEAEISIIINNPEEVEITKIEIEDMDNQITRNVTQNGITNIVVRATPKRYYDSYKLTAIKYKQNHSDNNYQNNGENATEQTKEVETEIKVQFYKEIYTYEDWQTIEEGTYQNYRLMADIDFSGRNDIKSNITVNRLEAENTIYTLKNINLEYNEENIGLIQNVKTSMKNIGFENITLKNTRGSGNYFGIISSNNGDLENLNFKQITIDSSGMTYVGLIGGQTSGNIHNIEIETVEITGKNYIGGLIGNININTQAEIKNITGDDIIVKGTGDYVGGIIGYQTGESIVTSNISIDNLHITGQNYTGGIIGSLGYGNLNHIEVNNTNVSGNSYVGGMAGRTQSGDGGYKRYYMQVNSSAITGTGDYIGGLTGFVDHGDNRYISINDTIINVSSVNSQYTGGIAGNLSWTDINYFQISNTDIISKGKNIGGVANVRDSGRGQLYTGYINNVTIQGSSNVGGIFGHAKYATIKDLYVKANIKADNDTAGGILGYLENSQMTAALNLVQIQNTMVIDTILEAPTKVGGFIGDIATNIYREKSFYYNNYIETDIISEDKEYTSLIIGGRPSENEYITNTYVYRYSTINGQYVYETDDVIEENQYLVREDLEKQSTYTSKIGLGTTHFAYNILAEGKYPMIKDNYLYKPELQEGIDLPEDPEMTNMGINNVTLINEDNGNAPNKQEDQQSVENNNMEANTNINTNIQDLPEVTVYPISVSEINIDFSYIPENTYFIYSVNGEEKERMLLGKRTYTFTYNFQDMIEIRLEKIAGENTNVENKAENELGNSTENTTENNVENLTSQTGETKTITIKPEDLQNKISIANGTYAYLQGNTLYVGTEQISGEYVNVFEGKALRKDGTIYNIETGTEERSSYGIEMKEQEGTVGEEIINTGLEEQLVGTKLEETTKARKEYDYQGNEIKVYGTYSTINGNERAQIYTVKNGRLSAISNKVDMKIGGEIVDSYNEKEYQTVLGNDGILYDLKEKLNYPENFENKDIEQIEVDEQQPQLMVYYASGKVIVFDYVTGEEKYNNNIKEEISLLDFIKESFTNPKLLYEDTENEYQKGQELIEKLEETPVQLAITMNQSGEGTQNDGMGDNTQTNDNEENNEEGNMIAENNIENTTIDKEENIGNPGSNGTTQKTNQNYISVYNPETNTYDIYEEQTLMQSQEEEPETENIKIQANGLEEFYNTNMTKAQKTQNVNGLIIVALSITAILVVLWMLRINMKKNIKKKARKK